LPARTVNRTKAITEYNLLDMVNLRKIFNFP
jgi:hypothetical protein